MSSYPATAEGARRAFADMGVDIGGTASDFAVGWRRKGREDRFFCGFALYGDDFRNPERSPVFMPEGSKEIRLCSVSVALRYKRELETLIASGELRMDGELAVCRMGGRHVRRGRGPVGSAP